MQYRFDSEGGDTLGQRGAPHQVGGMLGTVAVMHLPAHDLAAVQVLDQVQVKPEPHHERWQIGHVPAPDLTRAACNVRGRWPHRPGRLGASPVCVLAFCTQHPGKQ